MLIGEYNYSLDAKGRINFPIKLREDLGTSFIITKGFSDLCIYVYSLEEWGNISRKIKQLPLSKSRNIQRHIFSSANEATPDKQGRILIPQNLREYAQMDKDIMVIGVSDHCEIWSKDNWDKLCQSIDSESIAQQMEDLGI